MKQLFLALPPAMPERLITVWRSRPELPPGLTYNVSRTTGGIIVGIPAHLDATVVGTATFGRRGSDVDFGLPGVEVSSPIDLVRTGSRTVTTTYTRGVVVTSEYREEVVDGEVFSFVALPLWRLQNDAAQYARAASRIHASIGLDAWIDWKSRDKVAAYEAVGITCKKPDGTYAL